MTAHRSSSVNRRTSAVTSPVSSATSPDSSISSDLYRRAIHQLVSVGSLYDARTDSVVGTLSLAKPPSLKNSYSPVRCKLIKGSDPQCQDLLRMIHIDDELSLSLILHIAPATGIGALIDSSFLIDQNTRFLHYYYSNEEKYLATQHSSAMTSIPNSIPTVTATHVVTAVKSGIEALLVLQLSPGDQSDIDCLLEKICAELPVKKFGLTKTEKSLLNRINSTEVYSNIPDLVGITTFAEIFWKINEIKPHIFGHRPLEYTLRSIKWFYPSYSSEKASNIPVEPERIDMIKRYLLSLSSKIKELKTPLDPEVKESLKEYLKGQSDEVQLKIAEVERLYSDEMQRISALVIKTRSRICQQEAMTGMTINTSEQSLLNSIDLTVECFRSLKEKAQLINSFEQLNIRYLNMQQFPIQQTDDLKAIFQKQWRNGGAQLIFCSTDDLKDQNISIWNDQHRKWMAKHEADSSLTLVYADFSYSTLSLSKIKLLLIESSDDVKEKSEPTNLLTPLTSKSTSLVTQKSDNIQKPFAAPRLSAISSEKSRLSVTDQCVHAEERINRFKLPIPFTPIPTAQERRRSGLPRSATISYTNVLLLGESGVGKSTFINALANYLKFQTFEQAYSGTPLVAMSVSFLMTDGDNFEEKTVKFGDVDSNQDHDHPGQSVTQHCRSYVFQIDSQTKLRIIDTPGMGDTRGLEQDDLNMQHILSFINNLSHLNAICILLKPNESRLNIVLRSYFDRLLKFLGENVRNNIVFCFTNTRATFFAPGNTGPLLKEMIRKLPIRGVPFQKSNTFCFDSESFRYLIARQSGIDILRHLRHRYERSWMKSVIESNRLLKYISETLPSFSQSEWQSIEHAQAKIVQLIRPILETTRNMLRNTLLLERDSMSLLIQLRSTCLSQLSAICYKCERTPKRYSNFWILLDDLHIVADKCKECNYSKKKHINVQYELQYELLGRVDEKYSRKMKLVLDHLRETILEFGQFHACIFRTLNQNDPMLSALKRMISEEQQICSQKGLRCLNLDLRKRLIDLREEYEERQNMSVSNGIPINLSNIYELIRSINEIDEISEQVRAIKQTQDIYMRQQEKQVS